VPHAPDLSGCALNGRYDLLAVLGEGTFGRVYRGRDRRLDRGVAVKVIKPWWAEDPLWAEMFEQETRLLARLDDPGIVRIYDVGQAPEGLYYVSELVEGEDLAARLRRGPLAASRAGEVALGVCRALSAAHAQRIVHRDIKPANILLGHDGGVKVGDFGVARLTEGSSDGAASIVGTPRYMAPEQAHGAPLSPATDVYSVGVVLYEALTGHPPFAAGSAVELALAHLTELPPALSDHVPAGLRGVVARALEKAPRDRYADAGEMGDALELARARSAGRRVRAGRRRPRSLARTRTAIGSDLQPPAPGSVSGGWVADALSARSIAGSPAPTGHGSRARRPPRPAVSPGVPAGPRRPDPSGGSRAGNDLGPGRSPSVASAATRPAPRYTPRRTVDPPARRRAVAALTCVLTMLVAMAAGAVLLGSPNRVRVPRLVGERLTDASSALRAVHLARRVQRVYSTSVAAGRVVGQRPAPRTSIRDGAPVRLTVSAGPPPVTVPPMLGDTVGDAERALRGLGLPYRVSTVPAPEQAPGTVVGQSAPPARAVPAATTVVLRVAEVPSWHTVLSFGGRDSGPVEISGRRWRLDYRMAFSGTCTWILFCSGPTARVVDLATGRAVARFGLQDGGTQTVALVTGPGRYEVQVAPGGDRASWSISAQDLF
jgi:serine/threonine protein kinase